LLDSGRDNLRRDTFPLRELALAGRRQSLTAQGSLAAVGGVLGQLQCPSKPLRGLLRELPEGRAQLRVPGPGVGGRSLRGHAEGGTVTQILEHAAISKDVQEKQQRASEIAERALESIDGLARLELCAELGIECRQQWTFASEAEFRLYRLVTNLKRRHLPPAQLVRIGLAQEPFERERARARKAQAKGKRRGEKTLPVELPEEKGETRELIARSVGLKPSTYARGAKVLREGSPELVAAFEAERETVNGAHRRLLAERRRAERLALAERLERESPPLPEGPFGVVVSDPSWPEQAELPYPSQSLEQIGDQPIPELLAEDAFVWLWTTNRFLFEAERIGRERWGLERRGLLTWAKDRLGTGFPLHQGTDGRESLRSATGRYPRRVASIGSHGLTMAGVNQAIRTVSTSSASADAEPVVLRETSTTRLLFRPRLVDNPKDEAAAVNGTFVHQRKKSSGSWEDYSEFPLSKLKDSEWVKLELHASEVLRVYRELDALYMIARQHGVPFGEREFTPVGENVRGLLRQPEIANSLLSDDELALVGAFVRWIDSNPDAAVRRLQEEVDARELASFDSLLAAARLRQFNDEFHANAANESEPFWQGFFGRNSWVLARLFAYPFVLIQEQAYVGGKNIANREGSLADFLYANKLTGNVLVVEIKTPQTNLLGRVYRNRVFPVSTEVSGAITQALHNRRLLIEEYKQVREEKESWAPFSPKCLVVAGSVKLERMSADQRSSFELYRNQLRDLDLVTFDELAARVDSLIALLTDSNS
jgi:hypothetical protein